jgi:hypothetical protein
MFGCAFKPLTKVSDLLRAGKPKDLMPWGVRFSVSVLIGPEATQPAVRWVPAQYLGVKRPERGADHPPLSSTDVANAVELHIRLSSMPV